MNGCKAYRLEEAATGLPLHRGDLRLGDAQQDTLPVQLLGIRLCSHIPRYHVQSIAMSNPLSNPLQG